MKALQTEEICDGRPRSVLETAAGKTQHCRLYRIPANHYINSDAGGAGGIVRCSSSKTSTIAFSAGQPYGLEVLKAASNAFVAEE
jgi:hypothetical protein